MPAPFTHELRVRYAECDPQGLVFNANYLLYADVAYTELWRAAIGPWHEMLERGVDAVVAEANLRFHSPARFDDVLTIACRVARLGRTSITTAIGVDREGERLVEVTMRHVIVDRSTWAKVEMPDWVRAGLLPFTDTQPAAAP